MKKTITTVIIFILGFFVISVSAIFTEYFTAPAEPAEDIATAPACPSPPPGYQLIDPGIASGALCRGACGADCDTDACRQQNPFTLCVSSGDSYRICTYATVFACGSHPCCVTHDNCYDACATAAYPAICRRGCDFDCVNTISCGAIDCALWAAGFGPQPDTLRFTSPPHAGPVMRGGCPAPVPLSGDGIRKHRPLFIEP